MGRGGALHEHRLECGARHADRARAACAPRIASGWLRAVLFLATFTALFSVAPSWVGNAIQWLWRVHPGALGRDGDLWGQLAGMASFIAFGLAFSVALVYAFCRIVDRRSFRSLGWTLRGQARELLGGLALGAGILVGAFLVLLAGDQVEIRAVRLQPAVLAVYFVITLLVALQEELVFRGYVLRNLMDSFPRYGALGASAGLFALIHVSGAAPDLSVLTAFLGGMLLGVRYIVTLNLWFAVALHLSWNFVEGPLLGFGVSGLPVEGVLDLGLKGESRWTGGAAGLEGSVLLVGVLVVVLVVAAVWNWRLGVQRPSHVGGVPGGRGGG